ncbi:hypothetical protein CDD83_5786 [Cordyceps sp. RAO-2017]|nr:hypothetical protein CDD83_5786 [Cordyceps sp. RAO-2017]
MLLFSAVLDGSPSFRSVRMRGKRDDCLACSGRGGLTLERLRSSMDYAQFCGVAEPVALLRPEERVSAQRYRDIGAARPDHVLLDVRPEEHFSLGSLPGAVNVPVHRFSRGGDVCDVLPPEARARRDVPIYVVCRVGNDSQIVARKLKDLGLDNQGQRFIGDIEGGVRAWRDAVDPTLPFI